MGQAAATCVAGTVGIVEDENPAENPENLKNPKNPENPENPFLLQKARQP